MKIFNKYSFLFLFIVVSLLFGKNVSAQASVFDFQVMPRAIPCEGCNCDCSESRDYDACIEDCILDCANPAGGGVGIRCRDNKCYSTDAIPSDTSEGALYQCSSCVITGDCYLNDFLQVFVNIANLILIFAGIFAFVMFLVSGIQFVVSAGDPAKVKKGIGGIKSAVIGLIIVFTAWTLVGMVQNILGLGAEYRLSSVEPQGNTGVLSPSQIESEDLNSTGCCYPILGPTIAPSECYSAPASGVCDRMTHSLVEAELCDITTHEDCLPTRCMFEGACVTGAYISCVGKESCD